MADESTPVVAATPSKEDPPAAEGAADSKPANASEATDGEVEKAEATEDPKEEVSGKDDAASGEQSAQGTVLEDTKPTEESETKAPAEDSNDAEVGETSTPGQSAAKRSNKRKSAGVPEHKSKKGGRRKSQAVVTHLDAQPGDHFYVRMKGHPDWPSIVCDEEMLPSSLLNSRPVTAKRVDGTYREDFAEGGKREKDRTFPMMFLSTNQFAWIPNTDLVEVDLDTMEEVAEKTKGKKAFKEACQIAAKKNSLEHFKEILKNHEQAIQADLDAREERATKKDSKSRRKSQVKADDEDVEMAGVDGDEEAEGGQVESAKKSKKRKKGAESDDEEKPAKTPKRADSTKKSAPKLKLTNPKTPNGTQEKTPKTKASTTKKEKASVSKKGGKKANEDDELAFGLGDESPKEKEQLSLAELRQRKEKGILFIRHRLQKGFLTRDQIPKEEEMKTMSEWVRKLENQGELEVSIIRATKINKVLKAIMKLTTIPRDEEFHFKARSHALLQKWNQLLSKEPGGAKTEAPATGDSTEKKKPEANGAKADEAPVEPADKADKAAEKEKTDKPTEEAKPDKPAEEEKADKMDVDKVPDAPKESSEQPQEKTAADAAPADVPGATSGSDQPAVAAETVEAGGEAEGEKKDK